MPQPYLEKLSQELNISPATAESKWNQAKAAVHSQYPNLTERDDKYWALVTSITKKMLHVKESVMKKQKTRLQEADLSGGTPDDTEDVVIFDDYPTWVAAAVSCGATIDAGSVFTETASAYIGDMCVGEWNGDTGYLDCSILDQLMVPVDTDDDGDDDGDDDDDNTSAPAAPDTPTIPIQSATAAASVNPSSGTADGTNESFETLLDSEMTFVTALINEATVSDTQEANIDAQIAAADEKIENLRSHKLQLIAQKRTEDAKAVSTQINSIRQHLSTIRQQKRQLSAQRKIQKQNKGK